MFYLSHVSDRIRVLPEFFAMDLESAIITILNKKMEGQIFQNIGIVLGVSNIKTSDGGTVIPTDGAAYFDVEFDVLSYLPKVNEVLESEIKETAKFGAFASVGPFQGLLHVSQIGKETYRYDKRTKVVISRDKKKVLKKGDILILKIATVALKKLAQDTKIGLTMRSEGLGKREWIEKPTQKQSKSEKGKEKKKSKSKK